MVPVILVQDLRFLIALKCSVLKPAVMAPLLFVMQNMHHIQRLSIVEPVCPGLTAVTDVRIMEGLSYSAHGVKLAVHWSMLHIVTVVAYAQLPIRH